MHNFLAPHKYHLIHSLSRHGFAIRAPGINKKARIFRYVPGVGADLQPSPIAWSRRGFAIRAGYKQKKTLTFQ